MQLFFLFFLMIVSVLAEMVSIGAAVPFLSVLTLPPEMLMQARWIQPIIRVLDIHSAEELLLPLTAGFALLSAGAAGVRIFQLWFNARLTAAMGIQLRCDLYDMVLHQPYEFQLAHNSSELISLTTEKAAIAVTAGIMQVLFLLTALVMSCAVAGTLLLISPLLALSALIILGGGYLLTGYLTRLRINNNSNAIAENQTRSVKYMQEGLGGIREVILDGSQAFFSQTYAQAVSKLQYAGMENIFLSNVPKALLELAGIILLTALAYFLQKNSSDQQQVLPLLGALALGAQRLLPGLQQVYFSWSFISGTQAILVEVASWLDKIKPSTEAAHLVQPLPFNRNIVLQNVSFQYTNSERPVLEDICLTIPKGSRIGFVGTTGSGKSTLLDLVMGLLTPTQGRILIDGIPINRHNIRAWQQNIAHVSQSIFLADSSIIENIAFGIAVNKIDLTRAKEAAQMAQLDTFIETLPMGYQTLVGERGVRLSGGQRQRIGIARALYKQAKILVLDEATSALDSATEKEVIKNIYQKSNNDLTVFSIAHRLSTIEDSDYILEIANGRAFYKV
ncbi:ABC transporter ATP-binding protein [Candidatus Electronema sp. PJ]|uniref:ABC transporter ATP-binding protein n=1 Tax=Candidatus Electronema sp. PJ TaxID=3401572 RepID=UPI003AA8498E